MLWTDVLRRSPSRSTEAHADVDPTPCALPICISWVMALARVQRPAPIVPNEKILEAIQQAWIDERD
jgi:FeS assembly protein IscX